MILELVCNSINNTVERRWMETLLEELTYISAYEQDPLKIEAVWNNARNNKHLAWMLADFENLLIIHLRPGDQWELRNNISAWLDQFQVAYRLGLNP